MRKERSKSLPERKLFLWRILFANGAVPLIFPRTNDALPAARTMFTTSWTAMQKRKTSWSRTS